MYLLTDYQITYPELFLFSGNNDYFIYNNKFMPKIFLMQKIILAEFRSIDLSHLLRNL